MDENLLGRKMNTLIHEVHNIPNGLSLTRSAPRHIVIELSKVNESFAVSKRQVLVLYKGTIIRKSAEFSEET